MKVTTQIKWPTGVSLREAQNRGEDPLISDKVNFELYSYTYEYKMENVLKTEEKSYTLPRTEHLIGQSQHYGESAIAFRKVNVLHFHGRPSFRWVVCNYLVGSIGSYI